MVICLERGADLHMAQRISLPLTVSCFSKIQIGFTFLVPAHPGSPRQRAVEYVRVSALFIDHSLACYFCYFLSRLLTGKTCGLLVGAFCFPRCFKTVV